MPMLARPRRTHSATILTASIVAVAALAAYVLPAAALSAPYLVKNIKSGSDSSTPWDITALGDIVIFSANGGGAGRELWRSDGTATGTQRVLDIRPGKRGSNPSGIVRIGNVAFFSADDGTHGQELWVTDGTAAGTRLVKDIDPGKSDSLPSFGDGPIAVAVGGVAYFTTYYDSRLWRSDGTEAGTDVIPGSPTGIENLTPLGNRVYFGADHKLWRSDGTETGTKPVKNSRGAIAPQPTEIVATDSLVFFEYNESKLWRTNGTAAGTFKILDGGPGCTYNCTPMMLTRAGQHVFFTPFGGPDEVWTSDGTVGGTFSVAEPTGWSSDMFYPVGNQMYFKGDGLWVSDGSVEGTHLVDLPDGLSVYYIFDVAGLPYYGAESPSDTMPRLFLTDGTAHGTVEAGPPSPSWPLDLTVAGSRVFFRARDSRGDELWAINL